MPTIDHMSRVIMVLLTLTACGGSTAGESDAGADARADASPGDDVSDSAVQDSSADSGYLACMSASGQVDGSLKTCTSDSDCAIEREQTDCCGTILYVGVASTSVAMFGACEAAWVAHFPGCGCASNKTMTEDGKTTLLGVDGGGPEVHCTDFTMSRGVCMTYTP
jgi:hypothetical protein